MPRFKETNKRQGQFIPVIFEEQVLPGTIEHAICDIIDHHVDLSVFDARYKNDATGAPAVPPDILLKLILVCYPKRHLHFPAHGTSGQNQRDDDGRSGRFIYIELVDSPEI